MKGFTHVSAFVGSNCVAVGFTTKTLPDICKIDEPPVYCKAASIRRLKVEAELDKYCVTIVFNLHKGSVLHKFDELLSIFFALARLK